MKIASKGFLLFTQLIQYLAPLINAWLLQVDCSCYGSATAGVQKQLEVTLDPMVPSLFPVLAFNDANTNISFAYVCM